MRVSHQYGLLPRDYGDLFEDPVAVSSPRCVKFRGHACTRSSLMVGKHGVENAVRTAVGFCHGTIGTVDIVRRGRGVRM